MATDKPRKAEILTPLHEGEFWRISGIKEASERRLKAAGIQSFRELAESTPEEIAKALQGQVGAKERAARQDWFGQARKLAETLAQADSIPAQEQGERQHYETFLLELLLDDDRQVRRTRVSQVRGSQKDSWAGWDPNRLIGWIREQANLWTEYEPPPNPPIETPKVENERVSGTVTLGIETIFGPGMETPRRFFNAGQPLEMRLMLDLSQADVSPNCTVAYMAAVEAKRVGARQVLILGQTQGLCKATPEMDLTIPLQPVEAGTYRIVTSVKVYPQNSKFAEDESIQVVREGGLIHIYDRVPATG